ncbi:MAG: hypothetical protein QOE07_2066, partial [Acidimicrobiaceae bacterium]|nr:hypothetical protein [Acidimicrobiaceae bacterium]
MKLRGRRASTDDAVVELTRVA